MTDAIRLELIVDDEGTATIKNFAKVAGKDMDKLSGKVDKKLGGAFKALGKKRSGKVFKSMAKGLKKIGSLAGKVAKKVGKIGAGIVAGIGVAGGWAIKKSVGAFAEFESALVDMGKVTKESLESIKTKIMDLPPSLGSATEMVKGYYQVISAGVTNPVKALNTLIVASKAAKAAHMDQGEMIKGITKLMAGYEGEIGNASQAADLLYTIEKKGQTTVAELIPVIGGLAKISHDLGVSQDEMGGSLALITQTAGSTAEAATQYQAVLMGLMKPTEAMKEALNEMGYESGQAAIEQLGLAGTLKGLKEYAGGSAEKMNELFGRVEGIKGMSALAAGDFKILNETVAEMADKTGAADDAWDKYEGTLSALWDTFKSTVGRQAIILGEELAPAIKEVIQDVSDWIEKNRELIKTKIVDFVGQFSKRVKGLKENMGSLIPVAQAAFTLLKGIAWVFDKLGTWAGIGTAQVVGGLAKMDKATSLSQYGQGLLQLSGIGELVGRDPGMSGGGLTKQEPIHNWSQPGQVHDWSGLESSKGSQGFSGSVTINLPQGASAADDPAELARTVSREQEKLAARGY